MNARLNYWVDVGIGLAFLLSALSGLVFLLPAGATARPLGLGFPTWSRLHTWSSLALLTGVLAHLLLHAKWILIQTRRMLVPAGRARVSAPPSAGVNLTRRRFVGCVLTVLGGGVVAVLGAGAAGWAVLLRSRQADSGTQDSSGTEVDGEFGVGDEYGVGDDEDDDDGEREMLRPEPVRTLPAPTPVPTQPPAETSPTGVACLRGVAYDPYPGRCGRYTDRNGDRICDLSVPGSGVN